MSVHTGLPVEQQFATGHQGESIVLMVCQGWLWAGLYTAAPRESLLKVAASASRSVGISHHSLTLGGITFPLNRLAAQAAHRWLDRQGVRVRSTSPINRATRRTRGISA
ncbi:hypothetical protein I5V52_01310 [Stenotrophomonas maltophilia]|uniref:hypothetical protein n=1 Tax=Stenotrophomonas TaxID=40323 RepID=UPI000C160966|nr:hypothetical protein [Stenotrophomonas maltophilia]MBH1454979.1 hypothetical protein [Stenotrophomonas maltophilia]MBH1562669.1 hypothetical protein [Stenotrophomonas maltophilia]MBH1642645.1 hypothetical protein [Stenotrophomonas maltophilia]MBH1757468.1 hypothetical protein [Stenotrophomonas maltophilia]MBH1761793.1 hypothetical protein [Stenotrophomonas maltophilia]